MRVTGADTVTRVMDGNTVLIAGLLRPQGHGEAVDRHGRRCSAARRSRRGTRSSWCCCGPRSSTPGTSDSGSWQYAVRSSWQLVAGSWRSDHVRGLLRVHGKAVQPDARSEVPVQERVARQRVRAAAVRHPPARGLRRDHRRHRHRQDDAVPRDPRAGRPEDVHRAGAQSVPVRRGSAAARSCRSSASCRATRSSAAGWPASASRS